MGKYVVGLDNGGTVTKAAIFDIVGNEIAVSGKYTEIINPRPGYIEIDMEEIWQSNCICLKRVIEKSGINADEIIGVGVSGHGKGLYPWGKDQKPAGNGIRSTDNRAWEYPKKWYDEGIAQALHPKLCQRLIAGHQASILAWMKEHDRIRYDNIQWVFSIKDYIRFRLTGDAYCEATDISGSGLINVSQARYDRDLLNQLGIGEVYEKLAPIKYSHERCGEITPEAAALTGLKSGTPVAGGMFDIDACAIAMDITTSDEFCTIAGTWSINEYISRAPVMDGSVDMNSLFAIPGYYLVEECSATSAGNLEWFIKNLMINQPIPNGKTIYNITDELVESVDPRKSDIYYLPFLYGSNAHPLAKGSFIGLTTYHNMAHMLRSVYEGVVFSHKSHIDRLLSSRQRPTAIRMGGGAANSQIWVQMFADVLGLPIETIIAKELGALGCAMSAAIVAGEFSDYQEAAKSMVKINHQIAPNLNNTKIYSEKYKKYLLIREALDKVWEDFKV